MKTFERPWNEDLYRNEGPVLRHYNRDVYLQGGGSLHFYGTAPVEKEEDTVAQLFLRERKQAPNQAHLA